MPTKFASKTPRDANWLGPAIPPGEILLEEFRSRWPLAKSKPRGSLGFR